MEKHGAGAGVFVGLSRPDGRWNLLLSRLRVLAPFHPPETRARIAPRHKNKTGRDVSESRLSREPYGNFRTGPQFKAILTMRNKLEMYIGQRRAGSLVEPQLNQGN